MKGEVIAVDDSLEVITGGLHAGGEGFLLQGLILFLEGFELGLDLSVAVYDGLLSEIIVNFDEHGWSPLGWLVATGSEYTIPTPLQALFSHHPAK